jgi:nitroreductase
MDIDDVIKTRRSIRQYRKEEVPRELLQEVIDTALWAPSGMNRQEWHIVVARGKERDSLIEVIAQSQEYILPTMRELFSEKIIKVSLQVFKNLGGAPAVLLVYIPKTPVKSVEGLDERGRYHVEYTRYNRIVSASALVQNLLLAAHSKGLGTCWMTGPKYMEKEINEVFGITDMELVSIIPIGYPDQSPPAPPRKEDTVRWAGF